MTKKPARKRAAPKRPSEMSQLRRRLEEVAPLPKVPTQEEIARAYNALLRALRGE